jgi:hypothetical protein
MGRNFIYDKPRATQQLDGALLGVSEKIFGCVNQLGIVATRR